MGEIVAQAGWQMLNAC